MSTLHEAFHPECLADIVGTGTSKTCEACIAKAQRHKCAGETITGYLLCVAAVMRRES